jgi:hypothetical protein
LFIDYRFLNSPLNILLNITRNWFIFFVNKHKSSEWSLCLSIKELY